MCLEERDELSEGTPETRAQVRLGRIVAVTVACNPSFSEITDRCNNDRETLYIYHKLRAIAGQILIYSNTTVLAWPSSQPCGPLPDLRVQKSALEYTTHKNILQHWPSTIKRHLEVSSISDQRKVHFGFNLQTDVEVNLDVRKVLK